MTAGLDDLPERLVSEPIVVANDIVKALDKKKNIIYTPGYWGLIMLIIKCIPHFMFKKLNL
jgi:decaprenylphospho-beta-D-erythro-pentofuranosid-2-ulose 2-reductase